MSTSLLDAPLAIVDIETTGAHPMHHRVTEIAVIEARMDGENAEVTGEWSTLVNPETAIPSAIQALTGITDAMVAAAPRFGEIAEALFERLQGRVFVAHNARFDYGFLRREFERSGLRFHAKTLCTVKLSRRLFPEHRRHNLDSLIERHGLVCGARHRAAGDADAVWQFLRVATAHHGADVFAIAARQVARHVSLPAHIERAAVDAIPDTPGVYLFYGEAGDALYIGKSVAMRSRVLSHFSDNLRSAREMQLAREVRRIDWQASCGELGALLRESALVKTLRPAFNRHLQPVPELCGFAFDGKRLSLVEVAGLEADGLPYVHGLFRRKRHALEALRELADAHGLCLQTLNFEPGTIGRACFRHQINRCSGVCAGKESIAVHHARLGAALGAMTRISWPWPGPIGVVETERSREATEVHVLDQWCYLGSARAEADIEELVNTRPRFDYDQYRILARYLAKPRLRIRNLDALRADRPGTALRAA